MREKLKKFEEYVYDEGVVCGDCGEEVEINPKTGLCADCEDSRSGYDDDVECPDCDGSGRYSGQACERCEGTGRVYRPSDIPPD